MGKKTVFFAKARVDIPPRLAHIPGPSEVPEALCFFIFQAKAHGFLYR